MTIHPIATANRTGAPASSRKDAAKPPGAPDAGKTAPEPPSAYVFTIIPYEELAHEADQGGGIGLSPPEGYHLQGWKAASEAVVVCWERDDL